MLHGRCARMAWPISTASVSAQTSVVAGFDLSSIPLQVPVVATLVQQPAASFSRILLCRLGQLLWLDLRVLDDVGAVPHDR